MARCTLTRPLGESPHSIHLRTDRHRPVCCRGPDCVFHELGAVIRQASGTLVLEPICNICGRDACQPLRMEFVFSRTPIQHSKCSAVLRSGDAAHAISEFDRLGSAPTYLLRSV